MSYSIQKTDGSSLGTILDGTYNDTATSLTLVGRNYANYGQFMTNNLVALLENFAFSSSPNNPLAGQLWWDTSTVRLKVYTGAIWKNISSATASSSAPAGAITGDLWWDTINEQLSGYNGAEWILIGPAYSKLNGKSGAIWELISDGVNNHPVLSLYLNGARTSIISRDAPFVPAPSITGYTIINTGLTANTSVNSGRYYVTSNNSMYLDGISSSGYLQVDANNTTTGTLSINNDTGLFVGSSDNFAISVSGNDVSLKGQNSGGDISLYANVGGLDRRMLHIDGLLGTIEVVDDPTTALGIATKQYVDDSFVNANLTGIPTAPTAAPGTNTTQVATTEFVQNSYDQSKIFANNSVVEIIDTGTSPGYVNVAVDGTQILVGTSSGVALRDGATAVTPAQAYDDAGDNKVATTEYVKTATQWWDGSAKFVSAAAPIAGVNDIGSNNGDFWFQYVS